MVRRKSRRRMAGDQQGVVVGHFFAVHRAAVQLPARQVGGLMAETRMTGERGQQRGYFVEHVLRNVAAPRAGIGDELLFVKLLRDAERLFGRESVPRVGLFLESGQVVQQRRLLGDIAAFDLRNLHAVAAPDCGTGFVRRRFRIVFRRRENGEGRSVFGRVELEPEIGLRRERGVFQIAPAHQRQRGGLHPAQRPCTASGSDGECLGCVDAHDPVRLTAGTGREVEVVVLAAGPYVSQPFADGPLGEAADPQPVEGRLAVEIVIDKAENQLAFAPGVGSHDDSLGAGEQLLEDGELFDGSRIGLVLLAAFDAARFEDEGFGKDRKVLPLEPFDAVGFRHGRAYEVAEGPCDGVAAPFDIAVLTGGSAHDGGDLLRYRGLFCYDDFHGSVFRMFSVAIYFAAPPALAPFRGGRSACGRSRGGCRSRRNTGCRRPASVPHRGVCRYNREAAGARRRAIPRPR